MADKYKLYGTKNQGERVSRAEVGDKVLAVGGESVELTEKQAEDLRARGLDLRKMPSSSSGSSSSEDSPQETRTTPES